jgi:hypothetical protein
MVRTDYQKLKNLEGGTENYRQDAEIDRICNTWRKGWKVYRLHEQSDRICKTWRQQEMESTEIVRTG